VVIIRDNILAFDSICAVVMPANIPKKRIKYLVMILGSEEYFSSYEISNKRGSVGAITKDGKLTPKFAYLQDYVDEKE